MKSEAKEIEYKFTVFNNKDIEKYLTQEQKNNLEAICYAINYGRTNDNKKINDYWVVNQDETYADKIIKIILED